MKPIPYKAKMVEYIHLPDKAAREKNIKKAGYNLFFLKSEDVYVDLLTDSGTGAMSEDQWACLMQGDESYAGSTSFRKLEKTIRSLLGFKYVIPAHQGRGAEHIFNKVFLKPDFFAPGNAHFDTTKAHIENCGGVAVDLTQKDSGEGKSQYDFKGNIDLKRLEEFLKLNGKKTSYILLTVTCNSVGGQPVSMANIKAASKIARKFGVKLFFDIARFAENAFFIKKRERKYKNSNIRDIVLEMMSYADGALMSAKKDAIVNIGGFIALRDKKSYEALSPYAVLYEGFLHYGGMSGRDMEALARGLIEGTEKNYLEHRVGQVEYLGEGLEKAGIPVLKPFGGHAVYIDAGKMLPHIKWNNFPGQALAVAAYLEGGVRTVEIGSIMEGREPETRAERKAPRELLRLAVPRRVYSKEHLDHVIDTFGKLAAQKKRIKGVKFSYETPILRHFASRFKII